MKSIDGNESIADNCIEVGTLIGENDTLLSLDCRDDGTLTAKQRFSRMERAARGVSEHCQVKSEERTEQGIVVIHAMIDFDCTVEKLIFQMKFTQ